MSKLVVASTFSGGYGSDLLALKYLGIDFEEIFACELEEAQRKSYIANHGMPRDGVYENILTLDANKYKGQIDLLWQSPSCKQYSPAGQRNGLNHEDGLLMDESIRIVNESQPKMFVIENSSEVLSANNGRDWKLILKALSSLKGYTISHGIMNEKDYGTPQNRKRLLIVGFRAKTTIMDFPKKMTLDKCLGDLLEKRVSKKYYISMKMMSGFTAHKKRHDERGNGFGMKITDKSGICGTVSTKCGNRPTDPFINDLVQLGNIDRAGHNSLWGRVYSSDGIAANQNANGGGAGAKTGLYVVPRGNNIGGWRYTLICPSITTSSWDRNNFIKPSTKSGHEKVVTFFETSETLEKWSKAKDSEFKFINNKARRLTPREQSRVMGDFKDKFQFGDFSDTKLSLFIGNAVGLGTAKSLITKMLEFSKGLDFSQPIEDDFRGIEKVEQLDLFGDVV